jgi:hypothetical protein
VEPPSVRATATRSSSFVVRGRPLAALELAPLNLDLLAEPERDAALEGLAATYDAIPTCFQLLSMPAARDPVAHLELLRGREPTDKARGIRRAYEALYHELSEAPRRPLRRTVLVLGGATETELARTAELVRRVALDRGLGLRALPAADLTDIWSSVARVGQSYAIHAGYAEGPTLIAPVLLGRRWPAELPAGWLAPILALPGIGAVSMRVRPLTRAEAMTYLTTRLRVARAGERLAAERGDMADAERERLTDSATAARRRVAGGEGRVAFVDTVLLVEGADRKELGERLEALRLEARGVGVEIETADLRVAEAWVSALPGPAPRSLCERNLDSASLAGSLLHTASDLYEPTGHLYGRTRVDGTPIVLDRFGHESHNAIVLGQTGKGKTMFTGAEMARCIMRGIRVLGVDPIGDYRRLAADLGGTYLELGAGASGINPFAFTGVASEGAFTAKLASLARLVAAMARGLSRDEHPALDRALRATYEAAGIGPDAASQSLPPPGLADLVSQLGKTRGGSALAHHLERWATGSLAPIFRAERPLPLDAPLLLVGLAQLSDPEVRAVAQLAALSLLWDAVRRDLDRKLIVVDEAWKVMRQPAGAEFIEELARSARHYHAGLHLATQDIVEFFGSPAGETVVKQCDLRILLGQTPEGADALARYFDLTPAERRLLLHARPGEGLLFFGRSHVAFEAVVSRREYAVLTTRPSDLAGSSPPEVGPPMDG